MKQLQLPPGDADANRRTLALRVKALEARVASARATADKYMDAAASMVRHPFWDERRHARLVEIGQHHALAWCDAALELRDDRRALALGCPCDGCVTCVCSFDPPMLRGLCRRCGGVPAVAARRRVAEPHPSPLLRDEASAWARRAISELQELLEGGALPLGECPPGHERCPDCVSCVCAIAPEDVGSGGRCVSCGGRPVLHAAGDPHPAPDLTATERARVERLILQWRAAPRAALDLGTCELGGAGGGVLMVLTGADGVLGEAESGVTELGDLASQLVPWVRGGRARLRLSVELLDGRKVQR
ncbi:hypothetical protein [Chondromyces apiculatus]|uniref:Uncharacterized protein n=1 Tax=Chondromyces apiculatus DSM 436 TaxID=1192034 RepID=A0A017TCV7_9BACT|nr:hypothetical protein [Chondromyces apiculatus]EYF07039.1 Hypothetical protein CAP_1298 [Chondromyces apiculatus DSM 436]